jgi:hypothetical protein
MDRKQSICCNGLTAAITLPRYHFTCGVSSTKTRPCLGLGVGGSGFLSTDVISLLSILPPR